MGVAPRRRRSRGKPGQTMAEEEAEQEAEEGRIFSREAIPRRRENTDQAGEEVGKMMLSWKPGSNLGPTMLAFVVDVIIFPPALRDHGFTFFSSFFSFLFCLLFILGGHLTHHVDMRSINQ